MASQNDRKTIRSIQGYPSVTSGTSSLIPNHSARWKGSPNPIPIPGAVGNLAVKNPYLMTGSSTSAIRTNPTASRTLLSVTPRKTVRDIGPKSHPIRNSASREKGKVKATTPPEPQHPPSHEIIDVDADHASTDDLDLITDSPPSTSAYFDSKHASVSRMSANEEPVAGPSLIGDGEHTRRLQVRHEETKPKPESKQRSVSPIESFPEVKSFPKTNVKEKRALYEALSSKLPIIDFKKSKPVKSKMQPKGGVSKSQPRPPPLQLAFDPLSEPSGFGRSGSGRASTHHSGRLPVSMVCIGIQQCPEYETLSFQDEGKVIKISGASTQAEPILIPISGENFSSLQFTDPKSLDPKTHPPILYFRSLGSAHFPSWHTHFSSVFQPGHSGNRGQIAIKFNIEDPAWDLTTYKTGMDKLKRYVERSAISAIRPAASKSLWSALEKGAKYCSGNLGQSPAYLIDRGEGEKHHRFEESGDLDAISVGSSSRIKRMEELQKFRYTPDDGMAPPGRKRPSDTQGESKESVEVSMVEPPPKRQRTEEPRPLRRSTRQQEKASSYDADELILVYPFGVPGAVNVTAGDLARLQPEEFLNDTLIEFGLKSWLRELEAANPKLASQVYLFNSFFYKKLNKRNTQEGFNSVRKWTSKIDIFSKKYIIIPINEHLHWYLAVIYEPEHILQEADSFISHTNAVTRQQARDSQALEVMAEPEDQSRVEVIQGRANSDQDMQDGTTSENEVERLAFATSCSVITMNEHSSTSSLASDLKEALIKEASDGHSLDVTPGSPMSVDAELPKAEVVESSSSNSTVSDSLMDNGAKTPIEIPDDSQSTAMPDDLETEITPARFYKKTFSKRLRKQEPIIVEEGVPNNLPRTKIFILDSLGNRHPQAMKQLNKWLQLEAADKKNIPNAAGAVAKMVPVPVQPNYCDCGLYVLHFAKTFMSDPQHYCQIIMTKERPTMSERQADWKDASVASMRDELRGKILVLSDEWRQLRAAREEKQQQQQQQQQKTEESDEDSDVAIVEHVKASGKKGKPGRPARTKG